MSRGLVENPFINRECQRLGIDMAPINTFIYETDAQCNDLMRQHGGPYIDYLIIDIEGVDFDVLSAMDPIFQPTIIQCEHSGNFQRFIPVLAARGYGLLAVTDVNLLFMRRFVL